MFISSAFISLAKVHQGALTLKGVKKGSPTMCSKKGSKNYVLNHKTITGPRPYFSRVWRRALHNYKALIMTQRPGKTTAEESAESQAEKHM